MTDFDPYDDNALQAEARDLAQREQIEHRIRLLHDRRPPAFDHEGEVHPHIHTWTNRVLQGHPGSLILIGPVGAGKTWSLWKAAETLIGRGWRGRFEIAATYEVKEATDRPVNYDQIRIWRDADVFAIDDIGSQTLNDWDADALSTLIDKRWQNRKPTAIASNEPNLKDLLGDRAASRLADDATFITFTGPDRRRGQQ